MSARATRAGAETSPRVAICVATFRRPDGLLALLRSLDALVFAGEAPELCVVVADNDPRQSARATCEGVRDGLRHPLHYVVEKRPGIAPARNASLAPVLGRADWIAFVDDDEVVEPHWLDALLRAQRASGADVVTGPVATRFAGEPPAWVVEGGFFAYPQHADGTSLPVAYTNNALVRGALLAGLASLFDERLARGEDTELFLRLVRQGHRIVWAEDARVHETVPLERARLSWILERSYLDGVARAHIELGHGLHGRAGIALRGAGRLLQGLALALRPTACGRAARARGLQSAALGLGRWAGLAAGRRAPQ